MPSPALGRGQRNILNFFFQEILLWCFENLPMSSQVAHTPATVLRGEVNEWILIKSVSSVGV